MPVSEHATNVSSSSTSTHQAGAVPLGHYHNELNSAFPVEPGVVRRHDDVAGRPAFSGKSFGEKISNSAKEFTSWVKEEATEIKNAVFDRRVQHDSSNLSAGSTYQQPAGSSYLAPPVSNIHSQPSSTVLPGSSTGVNSSQGLGIGSSSLNQELPYQKSTVLGSSSLNQELPSSSTSSSTTQSSNKYVQ